MVMHLIVNQEDVGSKPTLPAKLVEVDFERLQDRIINVYCAVHSGGSIMHGKGLLDAPMNTLLKSPAKREGRTMLETITQVLALVLLLFNVQWGACKSEVAYADDPMNKPLDSLRVFDYDRSLCNDRWNTCGSYERTSFGFKYPGRSITELGTYPEAQPYRDPIAKSDISGAPSEEGARWLYENPSWTAQEYRERFESH